MPAHHGKGSEAVQRKAIQALESIKVLDKDLKNGGRRITPLGQKDLDRIAASVLSK